MSAKVSVLMPIYKTKEQYLREAIESILKQTYKNFEFLILDDAPDDDREEIVISYKDKRIKYVKNEKNMGISAARNKLINMAEGEYLAIFDHDDISRPTRLEKEVAVLDNRPEIGVVASNIHTIVSNKDLIYPSNDADIKQTLMQFSSVIHPVAMIRKSLLTENNICYEEEYTPAEDHMLWCRLIGLTKFYNIPEILLDYRDWDNNTTNRCRDKMDNAVRCIQIENEMNYPKIWQKYHRIKAKHIKNIHMFGFLPFLKIIKYRNQTRINLFNFIPLLKIKDKIK